MVTDPSIEARQLFCDLDLMHKSLGVMVRLLKPHASGDLSNPISAAHYALLRARAQVDIALDSLEGAR